MLKFLFSLNCFILSPNIINTPFILYYRIVYNFFYSLSKKIKEKFRNIYLFSYRE